MPTKDVSNYDLVVKELFEREHPSLLDELAGGVAVRQILNAELAVTLARRADLVFLLEDESILHLEFQKPQRQRHAVSRGRLLSAAGSEVPPPHPAGGYLFGTAEDEDAEFPRPGPDKGRLYFDRYPRVGCPRIDGQWEPSRPRPGDARSRRSRAGGRDLETSCPPERPRTPEGVVSDRPTLRLARLNERLIMELKDMATNTDPCFKNAFVKYILREDRARMLRRQLKAKFNSVPKWANDRLAAATSEQIERWSTKILRAETLEGVLGKK